MKHVTCAALCALAGSAGATVYSWEWNAGDTNSSSNGGAIEKVVTQYRSGTQQLSFELTFSNQISDGFTLAMSDGPNPKGHSGELSLLYFDASDMNDVKLTSYAYNGKNNQSSWQDGSKASGVQAPDQIATTTGSFARQGLASLGASDVGSKRIFTMTLDASVINGHTPALPGPGGVSEWFGIGFAEKLGIWLHPVRDLSTSYDANGYLTSWSGREGYLDTSNQNTTVPAPGAMTLAAIGGLLAARRRR